MRGLDERLLDRMKRGVRMSEMDDGKDENYQVLNMQCTRTPRPTTAHLRKWATPALL